MDRKIDYELFERILRLPQQKLKGMLESHLIRSGYRPVSERGFLYASGELPVLLVAHPRKELSGKLDNDSVAGSGDITNRVDTVLIYSRDDTVKDGISRSTLRLTKNRQSGKLLIDRPIHLVYSESSKRITSLDSPRQKHYGWESPPNWQQAPLEDLPF